MSRAAIAPYSERWPDAFLAIAKRIRDALGPAALRIDHIGSTAVPGLPAKNVIDVQVAVADLGAATRSQRRVSGPVNGSASIPITL